MLPSEPSEIELTVHLSAKKAAKAFSTIYCSFYRYQLAAARILFHSLLQLCLTDGAEVQSSRGHSLDMSLIM